MIRIIKKAEGLGVPTIGSKLSVPPGEAKDPLVVAPGKSSTEESASPPSTTSADLSYDTSPLSSSSYSSAEQSPIPEPMTRKPETSASESSGRDIVAPGGQQSPEGYDSVYSKYEDPQTALYPYHDYFYNDKYHTDLHRNKDHEGVTRYWSPGAHSSHPNAYDDDYSHNDITDNEYTSALDHLSDELVWRKIHHDEEREDPEVLADALYDTIEDRRGPVSSLYGDAENPFTEDIVRDMQNGGRRDLYDPERRTSHGTLYFPKWEEADPSSLAEELNRRHREGKTRTNYDSLMLNKKIDSSDTAHRSRAEKELLHALTLWTNGNVESARDPSLYDEDKSSEEIKGPGGYVVKSPSREDYQRAHDVLSRLSKIPSDGEITVHRGISIPKHIADKMEEGQVFDLGKALSSYSGDMRQAHKFARSTAREFNRNNKDLPEEERHVPLVFSVKTNRGFPIKNVSAYESEDEVLTGGPVKIKDKYSDTERTPYAGSVLLQAESYEPEVGKALNTVSEVMFVPPEVQEALTQAFHKRGVHRGGGFVKKGFTVFIKRTD